MRLTWPRSIATSSLLRPPSDQIRTQNPYLYNRKPPAAPPSRLLPPTSPAAVPHLHHHHQHHHLFFLILSAAIAAVALSPPAAAAMQVPTLRNVHIRSAADAHKLFYAVQLGLLPKIEKRLDANERAALRPGDVYVWEEKGPNTDSFSVSMERFTEGKSWTASRVREVRIPLLPLLSSSRPPAVARSRSHAPRPVWRVAAAGLPHVL